MKQRNQYQNLHPNGLSLEHHDDAGAGLVILVRSVGLKIDVTSWRNVNFDFQSPGDFPTTIRHKIPLSPTLRTRISRFESGTESRSRRGKGCSCCRFEADGNLRALLAAANANVASLENEVAGAQQSIFQNQTISKAANVIGAQVGVNVQAVRDFEDLVNSLLGTFGMAKRCYPKHKRDNAPLDTTIQTN